MSGNPQTLIVFGTSPDSYFVGHGRRHVVQGMPEEFTRFVKERLHIAMTTWISVNQTLDTWVAFNVATNQFNHTSSLPQRIIDHLSGSNGAVAADFLTFPPDPDPTRFFLKGKQHAWWTATLDDGLVQLLLAQKAAFKPSPTATNPHAYPRPFNTPTFDASVTGVLFGVGKTFITMLSSGFLAHLDGPAADPAHILHRTLTEFSSGGWCIERGSVLCFYDSQYYFLKFKQAQGGGVIQLRWNLPPGMKEVYEELRRVAEGPEEQMSDRRAVLIQEDNAAMAIAKQRIDASMRNTSMLANIGVQGAMNIRAAASGGTWVNRW
ncbi:hypothetical protein C8F01DRAFT_1082226 [Mycena amicta]|nr:hypothetical protein C8F01DRAFT_1082226 [Mycena amicta]